MSYSVILHNLFILMFKLNGNVNRCFLALRQALASKPAISRTTLLAQERITLRSFKDGGVCSLLLKFSHIIEFLENVNRVKRDVCTRGKHILLSVEIM